MSAVNIDRQRFLENIRRSGLLTAAELRSALQRLPETNRGKVVARALVTWGLLTRFQAELLLAGRTSGFTLGQYRILDRIGAGGMGQVFKARHQTMNRLVALKVLAPQSMKTVRAQQLFQREVRAAGQLLHPNIVTAYDAGEVGGRRFLVMEFVDGPNLDQLIEERGPLPVGLACELVRQTAAGLQYAFQMGMVHRDIKPANLLVQRATAQNPSLPCVVKILDFGLARLHGRKQTILTRSNLIMGTPDFVSPEQARDMHDVDIRSDLYSLGCTFYYLLTGRVPFPGGTSMEKMIQQNAHEPEPVEDLCPEAPLAVVTIVRRLMAKKPEDRFQTPAELAAAVAPFAKPGPATEPPRPILLDADSEDWPSDQAMSQTAESAAVGGTLHHDSAAPPEEDEVTIVARLGIPYRARRRRLILTVAGILTGAASLLGALGLYLLTQ
jgi:eukaryotic-like serine/threonine-protein kinase